MKPINSIEEFYQVAEQSTPSVVYFYTKWCPDCYMIKPHLPRLEDEYKEAQFYSFDRDLSIDLAKHLEIYGIPSFIVFQNDDEIGRYVDKNRKTYLDVKTFLDSVLKG